MSVLFGNLCIQVEPVSKRPHAAAVVAEPKVPPIIRCTPTAQPSSRSAAEYATVCPSRLCWHCCDDLSSTDAKRLPTAYNPTRRAVRLEGYFCSWECAKAYSFDLRDNEGIGKRASVFQHVFMDLFDEAPPYIIPAPSRFAQRAFGGAMEHDEYRRNIDGALNSRPFMARLARCAIEAGEWFTYV